MLGVTTYQDALRALGGVLDREINATSGVERDARQAAQAPLPMELMVIEDPSRAEVVISIEGSKRSLDASQLEALVLSSRALRGVGSTAGGPLSDLLRAVGYALDELRAIAVRIDLKPSSPGSRSADGMFVTFRERGTWEPEHVLEYLGVELSALRNAAAARRKGDPLRRVLILHEDGGASAPLRELLVAEFAVEDIPVVYASAVAQAGEMPHLVLIHLGDVQNCTRALNAIRVLRDSKRMAKVPLVAISGPTCVIEPADAFAAGAHDFLREPVAPAILRARLRTWLLRREIPTGTNPRAA